MRSVKIRERLVEYDLLIFGVAILLAIACSRLQDSWVCGIEKVQTLK